MTLTRDPLSEWFDAGARAILARAYAQPQQWHYTRLVDPSPAELIRWRGHDPLGADPVPGQRYVTRWGRAFARAIYYQHRWFSVGTQAGGFRANKRATVRTSGALLVEAGHYKPASITGRLVLQRGLAFRVMLAPAGQQMRTAVAALPASQRWAIPGEGHGPATSQLDDRDWGEDSPGHG